MKNKILMHKRSLEHLEISNRAFFIAILICVLAKLFLSAFQLIHIFPHNAPIDDELMLRAAQSIRAGNWLGEYNWLTMSKHMFFSVWLSFLNMLKIPYVIGGQLLYLCSCAASCFAISPILNKRISILNTFVILWFSPYSFAEFTLRIYRDNIFPSLCLLFFAGIIGYSLRIDKSFFRSAPFAIIAGIGLGTAWLTREDGIWLMPFMVCAALALFVFCLWQRPHIKQRFQKMLLPLISICICLTCVGTYCYMNYLHYGNFAVSDLTSPEFSAVINAFKRADTNRPHKRVLICSETLKKVYASVPNAAKIGTLLETEEYMNGYGDIEFGEYTSGGFCWAFRRAAFDSGFTTNAIDAKTFYAQLANEINYACDNNVIKTETPFKSGDMGAFTVPFDKSFVLPTIAEMGRSAYTLIFFKQTGSLAPLSYATPEQAFESEQFTCTKSSKTAITDTALPYYTTTEKLSGLCFSIITWCYRIAILPALALVFLYLIKHIKNLFSELKIKKCTADGLFTILLFGVVCSIILRIGIVSYMETTNYLIGTYLLYLSSAGPLILLIASIGISTIFSNKDSFVI